MSSPQHKILARICDIIHDIAPFTIKGDFSELASKSLKDFGIDEQYDLPEVIYELNIEFERDDICNDKVKVESTLQQIADLVS